MLPSHKVEKHDSLPRDDPNHKDYFGPRPPAGYAALKATPSQILLPLTVSNKCGQAFRWRSNRVWEPRNEGSSNETWDEQVEWSLCLSDRVVLLRQDEHRGFLYHKTLCPSSGASSTLEPDSKREEAANRETERWLNDYLNLDVPLEALYAEWEDKDPVFARFANRFSGLRMLRQDPWECLCAFVCSSNNNIARIGQMVQNLCTHFSPPLLEHAYPAPPPTFRASNHVEAGAEDQMSTSAVETQEVEQGDVKITFHPFPPPEALAKQGVEEKLRKLGFGYRAKYIAITARMLCEKHDQRKPTTNGHEQKTAEHLDESHWLYGIKVEGETNAERMLQPASTSTPLNDSKAEQNGDTSAPARKRVRRANSRSSRNSASSSTVSASPSPTAVTVEESERRAFNSVRSYLQHLRSISYRQARQELMQFPGIGPKVADCILLMSLDQASSIPVDRHVFQFAEKWYRLRTKKYEEIADYFRQLWGEYAGWAHSVLFTADLRSFADYNTASKKEEAAEKVELGSSDAFWGQNETVGQVQELGYPTPPPSQSPVKKQRRAQLQAVHSPPRVAIPDLVPQSLHSPEIAVKQDSAGATLAERIKRRSKRKSRLSNLA